MMGSLTSVCVRALSHAEERALGRPFAHAQVSVLAESWQCTGMYMKPSIAVGFAESTKLAC
jgi:hypothetical protein